MWRWLKRLISRPPTRPNEDTGGIDDLVRSSQWHDANSNGFGIRVFNCRAFCQQMMSLAIDFDVAARAALGAAPPLSAVVDVSIDRAVAAACDLGYPCKELAEDGLIAKARAMEFKWHAYQSRSALLFVHSWTGTLMFRGIFEHEPGSMGWLVVSRVEAAGELCHDDPALAVRQFDFLVKAVVYGSLAVHPLPRSLPEDAAEIAHYSFGFYGRQGGLASYDETLGAPIVLPNGKWGVGSCSREQRLEWNRTRPVG